MAKRIAKFIAMNACAFFMAVMCYRFLTVDQLTLGHILASFLSFCVGVGAAEIAFRDLLDRGP